MKTLLHSANKLLSKFKLSLVSSYAARHMGIIKHMRHTHADLDIMKLIIEHAMHNHDGEKTFVQIGANDGVQFDPYKEFKDKHQFKSLLVEPLPSAFQSLLKNSASTPNTICENAAIGPENGNLILYQAEGGNLSSSDSSVFASFDKKIATKYIKKKNLLTVNEVKVPMITFHELLAKHEMKNVFLLGVDTEGYDAKILMSIDFNQVKPRIIRYEHTHLPLLEEIKLVDFLSNHGYNMHRYFADDTIAYLNL